MQNGATRVQNRLSLAHFHQNSQNFTPATSLLLFYTKNMS